MKRLFFVALAVVVALTLIPAVSAQDSGYIVYVDAGWMDGFGCDNGLLPFAIVTLTMEVYKPTGTTEVGATEINSFWQDGQDYAWGWEWTTPDGFYFTGLAEAWVSLDGSIYESRDLYAPGGGYVATVELYAECPSGIIEIYHNSIYGVHMPDPAERVQAKVLFDVNVHSEPNPDAAIPGAVLLAGQDWFVVDSVVGTDGNLWYEVFVGGAHNGFVPAAVMSLPAPLP
ncbi:MAG: hypothetical protein JXJ20_08625 [Anaerolineae bacterium]|nr:hypothetical protein [Anaerolineae bacterium]